MPYKCFKDPPISNVCIHKPKNIFFIMTKFAFKPCGFFLSSIKNVHLFFQIGTQIEYLERFCVHNFDCQLRSPKQMYAHTRVQILWHKSSTTDILRNDKCFHASFSFSPLMMNSRVSFGVFFFSRFNLLSIDYRCAF